MIADLASVFGLAVTLVGFVATLLGVRKARRAAEEARKAAREVVLRIKSQLLLEEIEASIRIVREVGKFCRERDWGTAADHCDEARSRLSRLPRDERLSEQDWVFLDTSIEALGSLLPHLESLASSAGSKGLSSAKSDQIHQIITGLGRTYGRLRIVSLEV